MANDDLQQRLLNLNSYEVLSLQCWDELDRFVIDAARFPYLTNFLGHIDFTIFELRPHNIQCQNPHSSGQK